MKCANWSVSACPVPWRFHVIVEHSGAHGLEITSSDFDSFSPRMHKLMRARLQ